MYSETKTALTAAGVAAGTVVLHYAIGRDDRADRIDREKMEQIQDKGKFQQAMYGFKQRMSHRYSEFASTHPMWFALIMLNTSVMITSMVILVATLARMPSVRKRRRLSKARSRTGK